MYDLLQFSRSLNRSTLPSTPSIASDEILRGAGIWEDPGGLQGIRCDGYLPRRFGCIIVSVPCLIQFTHEILCTHRSKVGCVKSKPAVHELLKMLPAIKLIEMQGQIIEELNLATWCGMTITHHKKVA